jgi:DNA-directed RNA polymerase subunit RPC12/RpoP
MGPPDHNQDRSKIMKLYTVKSSAHRAAKAAGLTKEQYEIVESDGKFGFKEIEAETAKKPAAPIGAELEQDPYLYSCPHCGIDLENGVGPHCQEVNGKEIKHAQFEYVCLACNGEFGPAIPVKAEKAPGKSIEVKNRSTVERPTKLVWHIADEMSAANPQVRRKDVIAECVSRGIAFYTARTQYQQWLATKNGTAK